MEAEAAFSSSAAAAAALPAMMLSQHYSLHGWRLGLRVAASAAAAIALILACADGAQCVALVGSRPQSSYDDNMYAQDCWWGYTVLLLPVVGAAILWNIAEFITLCANKKGIHPGAHIALDMLLGGALIGCSAVAIVLSMPSFNYYPSYVTPADQLALAAGSLGIIAGTIHFVLFIMACIAVHRWRRTRTTRVIYVQQPAMVAGTHATLPPPPPGMMYLVPIPGGGGPNQYQGDHFVPYPAPDQIYKG